MFRSIRHGLIRAYRAIDALPSPVRERAAAGLERGEVFTDTGRHYHLRTLDLGAGAGAGSGLGAQRVYLLADVGTILVVSKLIRDVGGVLVCVALGVTGVALLLAWLLSRRLVAPLQVLAEEVRSLGPNGPADFSARRRRDEIGYLADRLGTFIAALQAALAREHAFTRDVSHELRTPLTVMNNTLCQAALRPLARRRCVQCRPADREDHARRRCQRGDVVVLCQASALTLHRQRTADPDHVFQDRHAQLAGAPRTWPWAAMGRRRIHWCWA